MVEKLNSSYLPKIIILFVQFHKLIINLRVLFETVIAIDEILEEQEGQVLHLYTIYFAYSGKIYLC